MKQISIVVIASLVVLVAAVHAGRVPFPELSCPAGIPELSCFQHIPLENCEATCGEEGKCCYENDSCGFNCKPKHLLIAKPQPVNAFSGPVCIRYISFEECQESCAADSCSLLSVSCGYICHH